MGGRGGGGGAAWVYLREGREGGRERVGVTERDFKVSYGQL